MDRIDIIQKIVDAIKGQLYVEIGVSGGGSFLSIRSKIKIGIDPITPTNKIRQTLNNTTRYFQMTSNEFFAHHTELLHQGIDVAFVDGLHTYTQSLKDVHHCLNYLNDRGVIVIHDCNPLSKKMASPSLDVGNKLFKSGKPWNGDVWKTIAHLRSSKDDLHIFVLDCDWGLGIITKGTPENRIDYTPEEVSNLTYKDLKKNRTRILNLKDENYIFIFIEKLLT